MPNISNNFSSDLRQYGGMSFFNLTDNTNLTDDHLSETHLSILSLMYYVYKNPADLWFFASCGVEGLIGILLNGLVIVVFMQRVLRKTAHNVYLVNLSIDELLLSIGAVVRTCDAFGIVAWSHLSCISFYVIYNKALFAQVQVHVLIAVERFVAIKWPHKFKKFTSRRNVTWQIVGLWLLTGIEAIFPTYAVQKDFLLYGRCMPTFGSSSTPGGKVYIAIMYLILPVCFTSCIYVPIMRELYQTSRRVNPATVIQIDSRERSRNPVRQPNSVPRVSHTSFSNPASRETVSQSITSKQTNFRVSHASLSIPLSRETVSQSIANQQTDPQVSSTPFQNANRTPRVGQQTYQHNLRRSTWIFFATYILYVLCYLPAAINASIQASITLADITPTYVAVSRINYLVLYAPIILNPGVHILFNNDFSMGLKKILRIRTNRTQPVN